MNAQLAKIDETVRPKLLRAIESLLRAGRNCGAVAEALCPQQSFGKYEGCTRQAIQEIAVEVCREMNRTIRRVDREIAARALDSLRRDLPNLFSK